MDSVIIVDDDELLCLALSEELSAAGYLTDFALSADRAFFLMQQKEYDVILLDLKMPGKDGFYVLDELNRRKIKSKVIVITAFADVHSAIKVAQLGAHDFISKPYNMDELKLTIQKVLDQEFSQ